ncbi:histidine kinase dimerization/phosphoacceptor domain -containing protein [Pedobacter sp. UBA5917]|jgi:two-component sensor histidine kinase|uniref:histidine kinase dimerization/phosphoacceptor domain -containing protein n=1 Tax=Pedobacter sp. UBA5917 TaxID=1947061 RepID=UPI0025CF2B44|nr:histidine kinase dimerization/phosphoacceptor domain -containing protein [Pedobacter sp. UBA5917]
MKIICFLLIALNLQGFLAFAQVLPGDQADAARVKAMIAATSNDSIKCNLIQQLGKIQLLKPGNKKINLDSGLRYFLYSIKFSDSVKLRVNNRYEGMLRVGEAYFRLDNLYDGKKYFMSVIQAYQKDGDKKREARTWLRFANMLKDPYKDRPEVITLLKKAAALYHVIDDKNKEAESFASLAGEYYTRVKLDSAEHYGMQALKLYHFSRSSDLGFTYYHLSLIYRNKGRLNKALQYALLAIDNANKRGDTLKYQNTAQRYSQLGYVYSDMNDHVNALENFRRAVSLGVRNNVGNSTTDITYLHLSEAVREWLFLNKPKAALDEAEVMFKKYPPVDSLQLGRQAEIYGHYYNAVKQFGKAESWYQKMIAYYHCKVANESWGNKVLAGFYMSQKKYTLARQFLDKEFKNIHSDSQAFLNSAEDALYYYKIDSANNNFKSALEHYRRFKQKSDSAFNVASSKQIAEMQVRYKTLQKEAAIVVLQKDRTLLMDKVSQANYIRNLIVGIVVLLLLFLGVLINSFRQKQKSSKIIQQRNNELNSLLDDKDKLLEEKQWLLKEIHHRVKNNLQIVIGLLQRQSDYVENSAAKDAILNSENRMRSIALIHQKLYQSEGLDLINMAEYVSEFISYLKDSCDPGNRLQFERDFDEVYLSVSQAIPLSLIMNEAITNSIKYARPDAAYTLIGVSLKQFDRTHIKLKITDNGIGLPEGFDLKTNDSMGMNLMRGLSKQLGGTFVIQNNCGVGIEVLFETDRPEDATI